MWILRPGAGSRWSMTRPWCPWTRLGYRRVTSTSGVRVRPSSLALATLLLFPSETLRDWWVRDRGRDSWLDGHRTGDFNDWSVSGFPLRRGRWRRVGGGHDRRRGAGRCTRGARALTPGACFLLVVVLMVSVFARRRWGRGQLPVTLSLVLLLFARCARHPQPPRGPGIRISMASRDDVDNCTEVSERRPTRYQRGRIRKPLRFGSRQRP